VSEPAHREPRLPPGQSKTDKWPVLHYGNVPRFDRARWDFRVFGLVANETRLTYDELRALPPATLVADIHCVTRWSRFDTRFEGVRARELLSLARPLPEARFVSVVCEQGYTTNLPLGDLERDDVLLAWRADGADLEPDHGWPLRLVVPHRYFWKSAKWVRGFELLAADRPGFWERGGYHNEADPWKEQRFRDDQAPV
jgi:DMSO/TMAO reductase YedYZ molybdopterin-dependent catalytic subunit